MNTELIVVQPGNMNRAVIRHAGELIAAGELVAFPTETVYGLGGDAMNKKASKKIYAAKGRPSDNPLIVHIAERSDLERVAVEIPDRAYRLATSFWPGPLTFILRKNPQLPKETTGGLDTVAVRMPSHPVALELIRSSGCLIAAPSANASGRPSPTQAAHVAEDLEGRIPMILDGGTVGIGIESTIVDLTEDHPIILRPGYVTASMLSDVLGEEVVIDHGILSADDTRSPRAPGMRYRHYAPRAELVIVDGEREAVTQQINQFVRERGCDTVAVIASEETKGYYQAGIVLSVGNRSDEDTIARKLYDILRKCDELEVEAIYSESFSTPRLGQAIMNRLLKAAGYHVFQV